MSVFNHLHDPGENRIGTDRAGTEAESAAAVERTANHIRTSGLFHGDRFAGDHAFIDKRAALAHRAIDRDPFAGTYEDQVALADLGQRHFDLCAVALNGGVLRLQPDQAFDRLAGAALGAGFQRATEQDQGDDDRGGLEIDGPRAHGKELRRDEREGRIAPCGRGAERDERIHFRRAAQERRHAVAEKAPSRSDQDGGGQNELDDPADIARRALPQPVMQRRDDMRPHAKNEDRGGEYGRDQRVAAQITVFVLFRVGLARLVRWDDVAGVARTAGGAFQFFGDAGAVDMSDLGLPGHEVDLGRGDTEHGSQRLFDPTDA